MAQVPHHQGALFPGQPAQRRHIIGIGTLEAGMGEGEQGRLFVHGLRQLRYRAVNAVRRGNHRQVPVAAARRHRSLYDIEVRRKVQVVGDDFCPARPQPQCRHNHLIEVGRGGVCHDHFSRPGADQRADLLSHLPGQLHPSFTPAPDEARAPLVAGDVRHPPRRRPRQATQRVGQQID